MNEALHETIALASLDAGLKISSAVPDVSSLLRSIAPGCKIPEYNLDGSEIRSEIALVEARDARLDWHEASSRLFYAGPASAVKEDIIGLSLLVLERLHQQRGCVTLHASAFARDDNAALLIGDSNMGKTTLLLEAMRRGYAGIGGEHCVIDGLSVVGGTKNIEFYAGHLAHNFPDASQTDTGWEPRHSIRAPLEHYGMIAQGATIRIVVFPVLADQQKTEIISLPYLKGVRELFHRSAEVIGGTRLALCGGTIAAPSLDSPKHRAMRLALCRLLADRVPIILAKGDRRGIINAIERYLSGPVSVKDARHRGPDDGDRSANILGLP